MVVLIREFSIFMKMNEYLTLLTLYIVTFLCFSLHMLRNIRLAGPALVVTVVTLSSLPPYQTPTQNRILLMRSCEQALSEPRNLSQEVNIVEAQCCDLKVLCICWEDKDRDNSH
jgi:hypothetical protein